MLLSIVIIPLVIGLFVIISAVSLGAFIYNVVRKNVDLQKKCLKILVPSTVIWILLIGIHIVLVLVYLYSNRLEIIELFAQFIRFLKS